MIRVRIIEALIALVCAVWIVCAVCEQRAHALPRGLRAEMADPWGPAPPLDIGFVKLSPWPSDLDEWPPVEARYRLEDLDTYKQLMWTFTDDSAYLADTLGSMSDTIVVLLRPGQVLIVRRDR